MAKKIRFPLEMENGIQVRTLAELREHFSIDCVLGYVANGKLKTWLQNRYEDALAAEVAELDLSDEQLAQKLCSIFDVTYVEQATVDVVGIRQHEEKLAKLKEYTAEDALLNKADATAFTQEDLIGLLDAGCTCVYLCGERFEIPLERTGIHYVGINRPVAVIASERKVNFKKRGLLLENVRFDEDYAAVEKKSSENRRDIFFPGRFHESEKKQECGLYQLKDGEFSFLVSHKELRAQGFGTYTYMQNGEVIYLLRLLRRGDPTELIQYNLSTKEITVIATLNGFSRTSSVMLGIKNQHLIVYPGSAKGAQYASINLDTFQVNYFPYDKKHVFSDPFTKISVEGDALYHLWDHAIHCTRLDAKGTKEQWEIPSSYDVKGFVLCEENKVILWGLEDGKKACFWMLDLESPDCPPKLLSRKYVNGVHYYVEDAVMYNNKLYYLRCKKYNDKIQGYEICVLEGLAKTRVISKGAWLTNFYKNHTQNNICVLDNYIYVGRFSDGDCYDLPPYRVRIDNGQVEELHDLRYEVMRAI